MKRAERLHALSEALRRSGRRGRTAERLAEDFGVSVRTIKRDLDALENAGLPLWSRPGPGGGYGVRPASALPPVHFSPAQAVALMAAVSASSEAPYSDLATAGVRKIVDVLDPGTRQQADQLAARIWVNPRSGPSRSVRSALEEAMLDQRVIRIRFVSKEGVATTRPVEPMMFASTQGEWFLIAWCRLREAVRWFAMNRVESATVTTEPCAGHDLREIGTPPPAARSVGGGRP
ncbi:Predicted DNA-binding transcriptional regulator YafY, contains an HTH and WYL domains [Kytococcus aerolatus]|uniref:Predicted DNA-binding transcriptional regulator YafY, contains an HTH and WYL domains n=2 Tax=Kytococcus aerolatus TaxID=592308 RepID=A0A212U0W3_9MICO|nr:Predicted DNA-binding transcriptional regulator YafY, contains an HTH and WYL domains [Kytococcus aerolatus]